MKDEDMIERSFRRQKQWGTASRLFSWGSVALFFYCMVFDAGRFWLFIFSLVAALICLAVAEAYSVEAKVLVMLKLGFFRTMRGHGE